MWLWLGLEKIRQNRQFQLQSAIFITECVSVSRINTHNTGYITHVDYIGWAKIKHNVMSLFMNETIPLRIRTKRNYLCLVMKIDLFFFVTKCCNRQTGQVFSSAF